MKVFKNIPQHWLVGTRFEIGEVDSGSYAGGHDDNDPPESDDENGLTLTESRILLQKIESSELQGAEKAKAGQRLLFGVRGMHIHFGLIYPARS